MALLEASKDPRLFGGHEYLGGSDHTSDCKFKCGCWAGPSRSGGPVGIDPFGECPNNPQADASRAMDERNRVGRVIERRIEALQDRAAKAEAIIRTLGGLEAGEKVLEIQRKYDHLWSDVVNTLARFPADIIKSTAQLRRLLK